MLLSDTHMYAHVYGPTHTESDGEKVRQCVAESPSNVCCFFKQGEKTQSERQVQ